MLELYELQVFLVAAETENFSETGRRLHISQPAVSGHIQALEQRLKTQLFERTGRHIQLNDVGHALVPVARNLLKEAQMVEEFVASHQGALHGQLILGCSTAAGKYFLQGIMGRFLEQYPDVKLVCQVGRRGQALDSLQEGKVDLAISSLRVPRRTLEYHHLADDQLVLIAPGEHPWANVPHITPEDLVSHPLILREASSGTAITLNRELAKYDMSLDSLTSQMVVWNTEAIVQGVVAGVGPGFVSRAAAAGVLQQELVVAVPVTGLELVQRLYMVRHTAFTATEAQTAFWDFTFAPENRDLRPFLS